MSFSMAGGLRKALYILQFCRKSMKQQNKKIVTLQVRILSNLTSKNLVVCHGKKAFLSVPASLSLEAAMSLTIFVFASVCLILPMKIMNTERKLQAALEAVGEDYSRYAYLQNAMEQGKLFAAAGAGDFAKGFCRYLAAGVGEGYAQAKIMEHVDTEAITQVSMMRSQILTEGEIVDLVMTYEIQMPFPVLGLPALQRNVRCRRRAWIGKEGKDYDGTDGVQGTHTDTMVYVGKDSTRYHKDRSCHYLSNNLAAVSVSEMEHLRSESGKRYHACAVCGDPSGNTVYIMPNGESYHSSRACTAIVAYVRTARLSEVEHLGPCSYCSR